MQKKVQELLKLLKAKNLKMASCESFTGGMFANEITNCPGASEVFLGGYITYSISMKEKLGISWRIIKKYDVVSQQVAEAMASATIKKTKAHLAISFTGNAGPSAQGNHQVGVAYICFSYLGLIQSFKIDQPTLSRVDFKKFAVKVAIDELIKIMKK